VTVLYPAANTTWTEAARNKIAANVKWTAVDANGNAVAASGTNGASQGNTGSSSQGTTGSTPSGSQNSTVITSPAAPQISALTNTAKGVQITWKKVSNATGYYVYRGTKKIATIKSGSTVSYTDTGAKTNNTKYTYKVIAYRTEGGKTAESAASTAKSCYYVTAVTCTGAKNTSGKAMKVTWKKNSKATAYQIQYSTSKTFASGNKTVTVKKAATVSTTIKKLTKGKTYYVRIRAYKTVGSTKYYSAWSAKRTVKISK
jgi:hypothetical protein